MTRWTPYGCSLTVPMFGAPMFIVSTPDLVIAQCKAGIVGSFPALNARSIEQLDGWLERIARELADHATAAGTRPPPFAVNLIVHASNQRASEDLAACVRHRVPIVITSLGARPDINAAVHGYGGITLHDVTNLVHARKAVEKGADGLIAVAAGAGGHAGVLSPFALIEEIRQWWDGPLLLSGAISTGRGVQAAQAMGADLAYAGTCFIAAAEANASPDYQAMLTKSTAADIVNTDHFTGIPANYLRPSIVRAGLDPDHLGPSQSATIGGPAVKAWRDIWGAGQGVGAVHSIEPASSIVARLADEYAAARRSLSM